MALTINFSSNIIYGWVSIAPIPLFHKSSSNCLKMEGDGHDYCGHCHLDQWIETMSIHTITIGHLKAVVLINSTCNHIRLPTS